MLLLSYDEPYESARTQPLSKKQINAFKRSLLKIARDNCPKDTTNMAQNAIFATTDLNGFKIIWDDTFAFYLPYVDKGINPLYPYSPKVRANKGFVARSIALMHAYSGLFLYGDTYGIRQRYGEEIHKFYFRNYFGGINTSNKKIVKEYPLFVEMMYRNLNGQNPEELVKDKGGMMSNLIKSLKKGITNKQEANELNDFINDYKNFEGFWR